MKNAIKKNWIIQAKSPKIGIHGRNLRQQYNAAFHRWEGKIQSFLESISTTYNHKPPFRCLPETPIFIPNT